MFCKRLTCHASLLSTLLLVACSGSSFQGKSTKNGTPVPEQQSESTKNPSQADSPQVSQMPTVPCTAAGKTLADLRTNAIRNGIPGEVIRYVIKQSDCENRPMEFKFDKILFDMDGDVVLKIRQLNFRLYDKTQTVSVDGLLEVIAGSDLFGVQGANRFHWRTDKMITVPAGITELTLDIDLNGMKEKPHGYPKNTPLPPTFALPTYLRLGESVPVEQKVNLVNEAPLDGPVQ